MKILLWDVETAPMVVTSWGLFKPRLSHENIIEGTSLICAAWKELGSKEVCDASISPGSPRNDLALVRRLRKALVSADVLVAHNGDRFDLKVLNTRLIYHGLDPLPPLKTVDTFKVAKRHFRFDSNRLDALGAFMGLGRKISTSYGLWLDILLKHDSTALAKMVEYNRQDVRLLEKVYNKLRPFMQNHPNWGLTPKPPCNGDICPICGKGPIQKRGFRLNRKSRSQAYQCQSCGGWSTGEPVERTKIS